MTTPEYSRIAQIVERYEALPEADRKALIDGLPAEDRRAFQEYTLREVRRSTMMTQLWGGMAATRPPTLDRTDPIGDAEYQMAEHSAEALQQTFTRILDEVENRLGLDPMPSDEAIAELVQELIAVDPAFLENAKASAAFLRTNQTEDGD